MRSFLPTMAATAVLSFFVAGNAMAAAVPGYETQYNTLVINCTIPIGTLEECGAAINAYSGALIAGGISITVANLSFSAVRQEVFTANAPDGAFQSQIDALFEQLLPDSGAIGGAGAPGNADDGDNTPNSLTGPSNDPTPTPASPSA